MSVINVIGGLAKISGAAAYQYADSIKQVIAFLAANPDTVLNIGGTTFQVKDGKYLVDGKEVSGPNEFKAALDKALIKAFKEGNDKNNSNYGLPLNILKQLTLAQLKLGNKTVYLDALVEKAKLAAPKDKLAKAKEVVTLNNIDSIITAKKVEALKSAINAYQAAKTDEERITAFKEAKELKETYANYADKAVLDEFNKINMGETARVSKENTEKEKLIKSPYIATKIDEAVNLDNLTAILKSHKALIAENPALLDAFKAKAKKFALEAPLSENYFKNNVDLLSLVELETGENWVGFNDTRDDNIYLVIIKENKEADKKNGKWSFITKVDPKKEYYIADKDGKPLIRSEKGVPDPKFKTKIISLNQPNSKPSGNSVVPPTNYQQLKIADNGVYFYVRYVDKDKDGKIDIGKEDAKLVDQNGVVIGALNEKLALLIDRGMNAESLLGDNEITQSELEDALGVIKKYAEIMGFNNLSDALKAYNEAGAFRQVSVADLSDAKSKIVGWLNGVDLTNKESIRETLKKHDLAGSLIEAAVAHSDTTASAVAGYLLRCAMASMTGMWQTFDVKEIKDLSIYNPKKVNTDNLISWLEGEDVSESEEEEGGAGNEDEKKIKKFDEAIAKKPDPNLDKAYNIATKIKGDRRNQALNQIIDKYLEKEDYEKAYEIATDPAYTADKDSKIADIAYKCINFGKDQAVREEALKWLEDVEAAKVKWGDKEMDLVTIKDFARKEVKQHADIRNIEKETITQPQKEGDKEALVEGANASKAIKDLDVIIGNTVYSTADVAYALLVKAKIMKVQADNLWKKGAGSNPKAPYKDAIALYKEMAKVAQKAVYAFIDLAKNEGDGKDYYNERYIQANSLIGQIVESYSTNWLAERKTGLKTNPDHAYYLKEFKDIGQYIKEGSDIKISHGQGEQQLTSKQFKKDKLGMKDMEHPYEAGNKPKDNKFAAVKKAGGKAKTPTKKQKNNKTVEVKAEGSSGTGQEKSEGGGGVGFGIMSGSDLDKAAKAEKKGEGAGTDIFGGLGAGGEEKPIG